MAASSQEKTEEATPQKLQKARERGEVYQSKDLTSAALLAAAFAMLSYQASSLGHELKQMTVVAFRQALRPDLTPGMMMEALGQAVWAGGLTILPLLAIVAAVSVAAPFLQVGALVTFEPLKPKLNRLNPLSGLKRLFFSLPTYVELIKATIKIVVIGILTWQVVKAEITPILKLGTLPPMAIVVMSVRVMSLCTLYVILFFIFVAALDLIYQRWQYLRNQRMTKEEVKREFKDQEGDPEHKQQRKQLHEEISSNMMLEQVREADVIVTNPEHLACALRYDPDDENAPRLLAKGQGYMARKIREIAKEEDIPIIRNVSLARALHELELNTEIPEDLYDAVAEVLKWVEQVAAAKGALPAWARPRDEGEQPEPA